VRQACHRAETAEPRADQRQLEGGDRGVVAAAAADELLADLFEPARPPPQLPLGEGDPRLQPAQPDLQDLVGKAVHLGTAGEQRLGFERPAGVGQAVDPAEADEIIEEWILAGVGQGVRLLEGVDRPLRLAAVLLDEGETDDRLGRAAGLAGPQKDRNGAPEQARRLVEPPLGPPEARLVGQELSLLQQIPRSPAQIGLRLAERAFGPLQVRGDPAGVSDDHPAPPAGVREHPRAIPGGVERLDERERQRRQPFPPPGVVDGVPVAPLQEQIAERKVAEPLAVAHQQLPALRRVEQQLREQRGRLAPLPLRGLDMRAERRQHAVHGPAGLHLRRTPEEQTARAGGSSPRQGILAGRTAPDMAQETVPRLGKELEQSVQDLGLGMSSRHRLHPTSMSQN
jgi:hypothetical protein